MRYPPSTLIVLLLLVISPGVIIDEARAFDEPLKALPAGEPLNDARQEPLKDLNGYFPFQPPTDQRDWERRRARLRQRMLTAVGLWPMPTKHDLNATVYGKVEKDDYTVERVYFESLPGFYVTGSLYRPKAEAPEGGRPGVLCPHGHWSNGRFYDAGEANAKKQIAQGAETMLNAARSPLQARCVQLARMGCTVFFYDMIGYADSQQISFDVAHRFAKQRPELNDPKRYGLFTPQAESQLQSVMQLQTYNSIRALDFLESLNDVDPSRLAVTGASGGGTQSFAIAALDDRIAAAVPAVMVSTAMQGGCTCENCSLLRVDEGNIAFAALFAPKPQGLTAANDWTKEMSTKGFPELKQLYELLDAEQNVALLDRTEFGHNYNSVSRHFMYHWFNKHLRLGLEEPIQERDFEPLSVEQMTVWKDTPRPQGGVDFEVALLRHLRNDAQRQINANQPTDADSARAYRRLVGEGIDAVIGRGLPDARELDFNQTDKFERDSYLVIAGVVDNTSHNERVPLLFLFPKNWKDHVVIWLSEQGKAGLFDAEGKPQAAAMKLLDAGVAIVGVDLHRQGEAGDGKPVTQTRKVKNPREAAAYTLGYNRSLLAKRVHDVLTTVAFVRNHEYQPRIVDLVALDAATAPIAAAARAQARDAVARAAINSHGFRFQQVSDIRDPRLLPGGAKYDDLPGMLAVAAPAPLWLAGETKDSAPIVPQIYQATAGKLQIADEKQSGAGNAVDWLLKMK